MAEHDNEGKERCSRDGFLKTSALLPAVSPAVNI